MEKIKDHTGIENCYMESRRNNRPAHDFFEKYGFRFLSLTFHKNINQASGALTPGQTPE